MQSTITETHAGAVCGSDRRAGKYLTFRLGGEEFGMAVLKLRQITGMEDVIAVPETPRYVIGVINRRGKAIPVIDLRLKLDLPAVESTRRSCILVVQLQVGSALLLAGIVVDELREVITVTAADIEVARESSAPFPTTYILGEANVNGGVKILLDMNQVLTDREIHRLEAVLQ